MRGTSASRLDSIQLDCAGRSRHVLGSCLDLMNEWSEGSDAGEQSTIWRGRDRYLEVTGVAGPLQATTVH